jgi:hypothetical protein
VEDEAVAKHVPDLEKREAGGQDRAESAVNATSRKAYLGLAKRQMRRADEAEGERGI